MPKGRTFSRLLFTCVSYRVSASGQKRWYPDMALSCLRMVSENLFFHTRYRLVWDGIQDIYVFIYPVWLSGIGKEKTKRKKGSSERINNSHQNLQWSKIHSGPSTGKSGVFSHLRPAFCVRKWFRRRRAHEKTSRSSRSCFFFQEMKQDRDTHRKCQRHAW